MTREVFAEVPQRVEYAITGPGVALLEQVHPVWLWAVENVGAFAEARRRYDGRGQ